MAVETFIPLTAPENHLRKTSECPKETQMVGGRDVFGGRVAF